MFILRPCGSVLLILACRGTIGRPAAGPVLPACIFLLLFLLLLPLPLPLPLLPLQRLPCERRCNR